MKRYFLILAALLISVAARGASNLGDFVEDATLHFEWSTRDTDGAPITRSTDGTIYVKKDNATTSSAGITNVEDADGVTGQHECTIDLSADAFYATGSNYSVVLYGAVIDSVSVTTTLREFSIQNRYMRGTNGAALATVLGAAVGASISADIAEVKGETASILADTEAVDTTTEMRTFLTGADDKISTLTAAQVNTEADNAIETYKLDHLVAVADNNDPVDNSIIAKLVSADFGTADWSDFDWTTDSLEAIRDRGDRAWKTGAGSGATESFTEDTNWTRTIGDNDGGAATNTLTVDGVTFDTGEVGSGTYLEVDVTVDITAAHYGTSIFIWGFYSGGGAHYIRVMAYNYTDSLYEDIGSIGLGSTVQLYSFTMTPDQTDTTAGEVKIKFLHGGGSGVASHVLSIDKMQINTITEVLNDGSGFTAIPWNATWDAEVESEVDDSIGGLKTTATLTLADTNELQTNQGNWLTAVGFSTHSAADVWAVVARTLTASTNFNDISAADVWASTTRTLTSGGGGASAADVWAYLVDGSVTATVALKQILSVVHGNFAATGTTTRVVVYQNAAADDEVTTHTITGTSRTN